MKSLSNDEKDAFLALPLHAVMGTVAKDGSAQLSPVWFIYEDETIYVSIVGGSAKHRNLQRDPRVSLCIDGGRQDVRTVMMYGRARLLTEGDALERVRWDIIRHYHEKEDDAIRYYQSIRETDSAVVILNPARVITQDFRD